ncbi:MAG: anthranilate synthase component I family protein [Bacteroidetes bacterium]|nr:anthranilate synthase component I family protein [Bacteroidota bacterium]
MRQSHTVQINDPDFQLRLLAWASGQEVSCILNSHTGQQFFKDPYSQFDLLIGTGVMREAQNGYESFRGLSEQSGDWLFGFFTYDLKNETEAISSENHDGLGFPALYFFQPELVLKYEPTNSVLEILFHPSSISESSIVQVIHEIKKTKIPGRQKRNVDIQQRISKEEYISTVKKIKEHIQRGDVYEMNYCVEFFAEQVEAHPLKLYLDLDELSPMPFSCFFRLHHQYLICASPERFLSGRNEKIISQPMKGTIRRGKNPEEDECLKQQLMQDEKEQSENVMIVDLVRNDLSKTAKKGSVRVDELFGIYTYRRLHQMISTVSSEKKEGATVTDIVMSTFPMGSMTGAPKTRAMQLIEHFEKTKRGLYSGSAGYVAPNGDFDFNVVIRSILYDAEKKYVSFMVGSAITANSDPEKEYEECLLKAGAMLLVLKNADHPSASPGI